MVTCSGLRREWPSAPKSLTREAYLAETADSVQTIEKAVEGVVVIGGGMCHLSSVFRLSCTN